MNEDYGIAFTVSVLKRLRRRMQMRSVKKLQEVRKKGAYKDRFGLVRAATWELACQMIDYELEVLCHHPKEKIKN